MVACNALKFFSLFFFGQIQSLSYLPSWAGMLEISLSGINQGFWSHLWFSGQNASILAVKVALRVHQKKMLIKEMISYSFLGKISAALSSSL